MHNLHLLPLMLSHLCHRLHHRWLQSTGWSYCHRYALSAEGRFAATR